MVTASHNPPDYNGLKFVREQARPISGDTGLAGHSRDRRGRRVRRAARKGNVAPFDILPSWREHLLSYVDRAKLKPLKIVVNGGNGGAGLVLDLLEKQLPFEFIKVHHQPDGNFPNGVPNPMLEENREATDDAVRTHERRSWHRLGRRLRPLLLLRRGRALHRGLLHRRPARVSFLEHNKGAPIVHDPRLIWNTQRDRARAGRQPVQCKSGHAFMKEMHARGGCDLRRRDERASLLPRLRLLRQRHDSLGRGGAVMSSTGKTLSSLVDERIKLFPASGEINRKIARREGGDRSRRQRYKPGSVRGRGHGRPFDRVHALALQPP